MGQSTDAVLFFGIDKVADEEDDEFPKDFEDNEDEDEYILDWLEAQVREFPDVEVGYHCGRESSIYYLFVKQFRAWRGMPQVIDELPSVPLEHIEQLHEAAKKLKLEHLGKPKWVLASYADYF